MIRLFVNLILLCAMAVPAFAQSNSAAATKRLNALQGTYLADVSAMGPGQDARDYGKFVIKGNIISSYTWDQRKRAWTLEYSVPFKLVYRKNAYYMTGYNLVFTAPNVGQQYICTGDTNGDGKMDLWQSDFLYHTKQ